MNLIIFFTIIEDLFNYLEDIFNNSYQKKYIIEKFRDLKMNINSFNNFYSEFIYIASDREFISEMLI